MTETSMPCDVPWGFDPMNPDPGFGVAGDEGMWYRNPSGINSFDLPPWQPVDANQVAYEFASPASGKTPFQQLSPIQTGGFPTGRSDKVLPRYERSPHEVNDSPDSSLCLDSRFDNLPSDHGTPYSLDDLLRTASQLATERALYMNIPSSANPHSPAAAGAGAYTHSSPVAEAAISSPSASPSHHSNASDTDEHDVPTFEFPQVYQLPDSNAGTTSAPSAYFAPMEGLRQPAPYDHVAAAAAAAAAAATATATAATAQSKAPSSPSTSAKQETSLTPLEMPDGSTRFTANWLPVDPQGGFTIRPPAHHQHHHYHNYPMDMDPDFMTMDYHGHPHTSYNYRNAFISLDNLDGGSG